MSLGAENKVTDQRSVGERLLLATLLLGLGDAAGKVLALIITILRTRSLSNAEYGGFGFIVSTIGMFAQIAGFSLGMAATRFIALHRNDEIEKTRQIAQFITLFGLISTGIASLLLLILAPLLATEVSGLIVPLRYSSLVLIFQTLSGLFLGFLAGLEQFRAITIIVFVQNIVILGLTAWWAPLWGLNGTILAMAVGFAVTLILAYNQTKNLVGRPWASFGQIFSHLQILYTFCIPSLIGGLMIMPANWIATAIIAARHGPVDQLLAAMLVIPPSWLAASGIAFHYAIGLREVGIFTAADQFRPMLGLMSNLVAQPMMPIVTSQIHKSQDQSLSKELRYHARKSVMRTIERSFQLVTCLILPAHAFFAFAAPYIMALFGKSFATEWSVFLVVLFWGAAAGIFSLNGTALYAQGRIWLANIMMSIYGVILVVMVWLLQDWGGYALAYGQLAASISTFLLGNYFLIKYGYLNWRCIGIQIFALCYMAFISIISAFLPIQFRVYCIPLAVGVTLLLLFVFMRSEVQHVTHILLTKLNLKKRG